MAMSPVVVSSAVLCATIGTVVPAARATAAGEATEPTGVLCTRASDVDPQTPPPKLYEAWSACIVAKEFAEAIALEHIAIAFLLFDTSRVEGLDPDATVKAFGDHYRLHGDASFRRAYFPSFFYYSRTRAHMRRGAPSKDLLCKILRRLGPPRYEPNYLRGHPALDSPIEVAPRADFEPSAAWERAIDRMLVCEQQSAIEPPNKGLQLAASRSDVIAW